MRFLEIPQLSDAERDMFWSKVDTSEGPEACWPWTKGHTGQGYGAFKVGRRTLVTHRLAYSLSSGNVPEGMQVDHECHNRDMTCAGGIHCEHRRCCNPSHLQAVTARTNTLLGRSLQAGNAKKTHCDQGHLLSGDNLYTPPRPDGRRHCKACRQHRSAIRIALNSKKSR